MWPKKLTVDQLHKGSNSTIKGHLSVTGLFSKRKSTNLDDFDSDLQRGVFTFNKNPVITNDILNDNGKMLNDSPEYLKIKNAWNQYLNLSSSLVTACTDYSNANNPIKYDYNKDSSTFDITISNGKIIITSKTTGINRKYAFSKNSIPEAIDGYIETVFSYDSTSESFILDSCICSNESMEKIALGVINKPAQIDKLDTSPQNSTEYPKPSFIKRIGNWCKRHPILTGLMIGVAAPLLVVGGAIGIVALAHALPVLAPAALFIGGIAAIAYGALHVLGIVGVAATATAIATPSVVGGTVGVSAGAIAQCSTAKVMGKTGANPKNKKGGIEGYVEFSKELNKTTNDNKNQHTSSCSGILSKVFRR